MYLLLHCRVRACSTRGQHTVHSMVTCHSHALPRRNSQNNSPLVSCTVIPTESYTETSNLRTFSSINMTTSSWLILDSHGHSAFPCERTLTKYVSVLGITPQLTRQNIIGRNALVSCARSTPWLSALWDSDRHVVCWMYLCGDGQQRGSALSGGFRDRPNLQDLQVSLPHFILSALFISLTPV